MMDMSQNPDQMTEAAAPAAHADAETAREMRSAWRIWGVLIAVLGAWGVAGIKFGALGLALPAVAAVPVYFVVLLLITLG